MTAHNSPPLPPLPPERWERLAAALSLLREAAPDARRLGRDAGEFAVEIGQLLASGLRSTDLRWMLAHGLVEHAVEQSQLSAPGGSSAASGASPSPPARASS